MEKSNLCTLGVTDKNGCHELLYLCDECRDYENNSVSRYFCTDCYDKYNSPIFCENRLKYHEGHEYRRVLL